MHEAVGLKQSAQLRHLLTSNLWVEISFVDGTKSTVSGLVVLYESSVTCKYSHTICAAWSRIRARVIIVHRSSFSTLPVNKPPYIICKDMFHIIVELALKDEMLPWFQLLW